MEVSKINNANDTFQHWMMALAFLVLFVGVGRVSNLVLHVPLLGYGNSYDMIRIQACHQIWPADTHIDITQGTPDAPLRWYKQYQSKFDVKCFPSSELIFTGAGINLSKIIPAYHEGNKISIQGVGVFKALILCLTAIGATLLFIYYRQPLLMWINVVTFAIVLTDPGITLYLNTFYTEFSAVYFLYLFQLSLALLHLSRRRLLWIGLLVISLLGLGFAKPQHAPLAILLGAISAIYLLYYKFPIKALVVFLASTPPLLLYVFGVMAPRNEIMELANQINSWGMLLGLSSDASSAVNALNLPDHCRALVGAQWQGQASLDNPPCNEIRATTIFSKLHLFWIEPKIFWLLISEPLPLLKDWTLMVYGNVEGRPFASVSDYHIHLWQLIGSMTNSVFVFLFLLPNFIFLLMIFGSLALSDKFSLIKVSWLGVTLLTLWVVYFTAILGDGLFDFSKHCHLIIPSLVLIYAYLFFEWGAFAFNFGNRVLRGL